ncbi:phospholipase A2 inhibitor NAI-like isoform X2 [Dendropsophus ebraccatus]|uniref:phospholipase A2 inhibitor NAI-like isoform X2 n=1 Tax=Dendropsophus ebraccatus TaxID=150705 RepID=UPI0038311BFE
MKTNKNPNRGFHLTVGSIYKNRTMTSMTGILSLLSALIATSDALSCTECISTIFSSCSGPSVTCPSGYQCGSTYTKSFEGGMTSTVFVRSCMPSSHCNLVGSISQQQGQIKTVSSCCNTANCNPTVPALPTPGSNLNGVVCRSCLSAKSDWCYTKDTISCTGNENMCLLQTSKITGSVSLSTAIRGCATKSLCDLGSQSYSANGESTDIKFTCTSGGISVHQVVLAPAVACLLLLKLFF